MADAAGATRGRPLKFKTVAALNKAIAAYFAECDPHWIVEKDWTEKRDRSGQKVKDENGQDMWVELPLRKRTAQLPYTMSGLARALDTTRETLLDYGKGKHDGKAEDSKIDADFSDSIRAALTRCEEFAESMLFGAGANGAKFNLINNYKRWAEKQEIDHTSKGQVMPLLGGAVQLDPENVDEPEQPATE